MSLYGVMRTSMSGMAAQASRLATVADNIANVSTNGYKRSYSDFASLLISEAGGQYNSGGVLNLTRHTISEQGSIRNTQSVTDLAIQGDGFFIVSDAGGQPFLSRAGSFVKNENDELVNAGGFRLMGYPIQPGQLNPSVNGFAGLVPVTLSSLALTATPSQAGQFVANLPSNDAVVAAANLPSANAATAQYSGKSSLIAYDNLGNRVILDTYFTKTAANTWEVTTYNQADATNGGFPYTAAALQTSTVTFDAMTGALTSASPQAITVNVPGGQTLNIDISNMSQLATSYQVLTATLDGNAPSAAELVEITKDGTVFAVYGNGTRTPVFRIPLATVNSPDNLEQLSGNVFQETQASGSVVLGLPETANYGSILSGALEESTVDLATELTIMIDSQRSYSANSKVFQTGSELMDVLINLKR